MTERAQKVLPWFLLAFVTAAAVAISDPPGSPLPRFLSYLAISGVGAALMALAYRQVADVSMPRTILLSVVVALALRIGVGVVLYRTLPVAGYGTKSQQLGYVYYDAYTRDTDAYARGRSDQPLLSAFLDRKSSDQYGGLLFISSGIYRYLSDGTHHPLMVSLLAAYVSSLIVLFTWGFVGMTFGGRAGVLAAWIAAIYPDLVLLGSSQMREAFIVPSMTLALYGFARTRLGDWRLGAAPILIGVLTAAFISPPFGLLCLTVVAVLWAVEARSSARSSRWLLLGLIIGGVVTAGLTVWAWSSADGNAGAGIGWLGRRLVEVPRFQLQQLEEGSGWVQKLFEQTPDGLHMPMAVLYGLTQPFLPAALGDNSGLLIWRVIAVYRAIGWFAILPALLYAPIGAITSESKRRLLLGLILVGWGGAILGSYWGAGDLWDNPRYRISVLPVQLALVAWAFFHSRQVKDPWLQRSYLVVLGWSVLFLQWYAGRYFGTPQLGLIPTLLFGIGLTLAYLAIVYWRSRRPKAAPA